MITARKLAENYVTLNPAEFADRPVNWPDLERIFGNWLDKPRLAMSNWCGKVTRAFFIAHNLTPPKRLVDVEVQFAALYQKPKPYDNPHADSSGQSRPIVIASVLDDSGTGGNTVMHLTPAEEREYNRGMAMLAEMG